MTHSGAFPHGSRQGYDHGCRSKGGCPFRQDTATLTCVEAAIAARGDRTLAVLPANQPIPRTRTEFRVSAVHESAREQAHGTVWRYRNGCTDPQSCPHWRLGRVTCAEARRRYFAEYHARRRDGEGTPIRHGTSAGYLSGCTSEHSCPGGEHGRSCHEARAEYRRQRARGAGVGPPAPTVPSGEAVRLVIELAQSPMTGREIARITGIGRSTIAKLMNAHHALERPSIREYTLTAIRVAHATHAVVPVQRARASSQRDGTD